MMQEAYTLSMEIPTVEDYRRLRLVTGLSGKTEEAARLGLPNSWSAAVVRHRGRVVAMGRVIGDGGCFFQVCDMAVEPEHQGQGLGKRIFARLMEDLQARAPKSAYVSLIADGDAKHLYAKFGFEPVMPASIGMAIWIGGRPSRGS
ncbi:AttT protein [Aureimonas altamirensis]|uniref:AttT protein n=2 Tax=Aureimonas altamirensis TaxID=370622 RepID=A0A0B1Q4N0_9HYPH|nr:GNAT family N-acetyltransferase [Aureimonas altamirensis]KHJ55344.1 AttT protein [Aureimonas altamirensis]